MLLMQLATARTPLDSVYASPALRVMIADAAVTNREPPPEFRSYRARVETELALILRDTLGRERAAQIEQLAADAHWARMGAYDLHVIGYRSQTVGVPYSALSIVRGWTVPSLYGDRLLLGAAFGRNRTGAVSNEIVAVHPFAGDRDRFYRFSGGDTVTVLRVGNRAIPIARIKVQPHPDDPTRLGLFDGEIDLDAQRGQIVRMRGQFVIVDGRDHASLMSRLPGIIAVAYVEFVNAEVGGRYWLPTSQRTEFQATVALLGQTRSVFRLVSRFSDFAIDSGPIPIALDSMRRAQLVVSYAPTDTVSHFAGWRHGLGATTSSVTADDFDDIGPDAWRSDGPPRLDLVPTKSSEMLRFDRVEGLYTGLSMTMQFRNVVPGLTVGAFGGWAWTEQTARGGARASLQRSEWVLGGRVERALVSTNDFPLPLEDGGGIGALLYSVDDFDYVDRKSALVSVTHIFGGVDAALATVQLGIASDDRERARSGHGILGGGGFRPNRGAADGRYALGVAELEVHPNVTGDFVQPGIGARIHYERAAGDLAWQRVELGLSARRYWGRLSIAAHADGGVLFAAEPPPQVLFELGGSETLPGYAYKEFAGDRAALFRAYASYRFPIWSAPLHFVRTLYIPGVNPGLAVGAHGGWSELSSDGARRAAQQLGADWSSTPISRPTGGVRATVGAGVTLFSDIVHVGVARPVDRAAPWRLVAGFGQSF